MGRLWLHKLNVEDYLREWGIAFEVYPGFESRSRSSGGFDYIWGIQIHHTVSNTSPKGDLNYNYHVAADRPIGNILLDRTGRAWLGASGATNTSGKGGPRRTANGTLPLNVGNTRLIAIEAANNGVGEPWPEPQQNAYPRLCAALKQMCDNELGQKPLEFADIHSHREWAPTRKVDTRGPSRWGTGIQPWNMDAFRGDVFVNWMDHFAAPPVPDPTPAPIPPPAAAPPAVPEWDLNRWLWEGAQGDDVTWLQRVLRAQVGHPEYGLAAGFYPQADSTARQLYLIAAKNSCATLVDDGLFGVKTREAVAFTGAAFDWTGYNGQHIGPCNFKDGRIGPGAGNGWEFVYKISDGIWY